MVDKNKAVVCCLLAKSAIMLSEKKTKRKMWSKKWYLKTNISCDAKSAEWLANGCALRRCHRDFGRYTEETVGFPEWTVQFSVWKTTGKDSSEACAIACQNCAVYSLFPPGMTTHSKIALFISECTGRLRSGSAAAHLLGLWVRIPPGAWMFVSCECCVLSGRGMCIGLITRPEES